MNNDKTVLVVDDNPDELMIYSTLLRHAGYTTLVANDPDTAIRLATERKPDLALVDLQLRSEKDGCDVIETLRTTSGISEMPVIAHTAYAEAYHGRLRNVGVEVIEQKPLDYDRLLTLVGELIGGVART